MSSSQLLLYFFKQSFFYFKSDFLEIITALKDTFLLLLIEIKKITHKDFNSIRTILRKII